MAKNIFIFVIIQALMLQLSFGQVLNRYGGCGCGGVGPYLSSPVIYDQPITIIQDSTVANNLANALQLLVVSNLLSSTLPLDSECDLLASAPSAQLAPIAPLASGPYAPIASLGQVKQLNSLVSPCGCGGCGCGCGGCGCGCGGCGCGQYPYNIIY